MNFVNKKILLVVAHPDDELLGCGATIHRLINEFDSKIHVVIFGEGITSRSEKRNLSKWKEELANHRQNLHSAQKILGYQSVSIYDFPDNRFDTVPLLDIIKVIEKEKVKFKPEIVFTHHGGDLNIDHQRTFEAVMTAFRPMEHEEAKTIITFETPSGTEWRASSDPKHFIPNLFINISEDDLMAKIMAMDCYLYEKRSYPHPRSPEALKVRAQMWGVAMGTSLSEAFCVIRSII